MRIRIIEDDQGDAVDAVAFCCESCHRRWCKATGEDPAIGTYEEDAGEALAWCAACGVRVGIGANNGYEPSANCDGGCLPTVVNLIIPADPIGGDPLSVCPHGISHYLLTAVDPAMVAATDQGGER